MSVPPVTHFQWTNYPSSVIFRGQLESQMRDHQMASRSSPGGLKEEAENRLARKSLTAVFFGTMLEMATDFDIDDEGIRSLTGALLFGGATTPASATLFIIYLAAAYPEFQCKVQEELDQVVGKEHAPRVEDLSSLPYPSILLPQRASGR
ncbi:hypothetical protein FRC03_006831 [Tulasnella sp. 419]|nr:hypothetical protein FRC03_006831 [Tulasnella sp. 419]